MTSQAPHCVIETVTPQKAQLWLKSNHGNRPVIQSSVNHYARLMAMGLWTLTHQGIAFSARGRLLDGQHRLMAIMKAGVSVQMMVTRHLADEAFQHIDDGQRRKAFVLNGLPERVSEAMNVGCLLMNITKSRSDGKVPALAQVGIYQALASDYEALLAFCPKRSQIFGNAPVRFAAAMTMAQQEEPSSKDYVLIQYAALNSQDFAAMSTSSATFYRQLTIQRGVNKSDRLEMFSRAMIALNPHKPNLTRILLDDQREALISHRLALMTLLDERLMDETMRGFFALPQRDLFVQ